jgi:hypothetical protein
MAMASASCASLLIDPYDIAPVLNRRMMFSIGSTSSAAPALPGFNSSKRPQGRRRPGASFNSAEYSLNFS